jgi:pilus assembly protein CpaF
MHVWLSNEPATVSDLPTRAIREQIASALDLIVHVARFRDGSRRISHFTGVVGMEGEVITLQDVFRSDYSFNRLVSTGIRPEFADRLAELGVELPATHFGEPELAWRG